MAFQQGLSGLSVSSKALDVISNNISNASTIGFKGAHAQFADMYAASLGVGGSSQVGIGASLPAVQQLFSQGNISNSDNPLDIAINGSGFFRLQKSVTDSTASYTRNGQYHLDDQGYMVNAQGNNLTGYQIVDGVTNRATLVPIKLDTTGVDPSATGSASINPGIFTQINLDDRDPKSLSSTTPNNLALWTANSSFPPNNLNTFNYSTSVTVYDQKGNDHSLSMYFTRLAPSTDNSVNKNLWETHYVMDGVDITSAVSPATSTLTYSAGANNTLYPAVEFDGKGQIVTTNFSNVPGEAVDFQFKIDTSNAATGLGGLPTPGTSPFAGLFDPLKPIPIDFSNSTMFGSGYDVNKLTQDGFPYGRLSSVTISPDGVLRGSYTNGQTKDIAQLVLVDFISTTGLSSIGNNQWVETAASGQPLVGDPGTGSRGVLQASAVEEANIDLTSQLVDLITQQRNYQANAQSIKTQDQVMQTLVNLR